MKNLRIILFSLVSALNLCYSYAQVGVNTTAPQSTLDVTGIPSDASVPDGILIPRITGDELAAKTVYTAAQTGALVFVTSAVTTSNAQTVNVVAAGFYFFDGMVWQIVGGGGLDGDAWGVTGEDIASDITRTGNIEVSDNRGDFRTELLNEQFIGTENGTNRYITLESERTGNTNPIAGLRWLNTDDNQYTAATIAAVNSNENSENGVDDGKLFFQTANAGILSTKMVIENQGNVGIGAQNPNARLQIAPYDTFTAGVTPPETLFRLQSPSISGVKFATTADIRLGDLNPTGTQTRAQLDFVLSNGSTNIANNTVMTLLGNNRIGIATTTPEANLDVNGNARVRTVPNGQSTDFVLTADNEGNVRRRTMQQVVGDGTMTVQQTLATAIVTNNLVIPLTTSLGNPGSTPGEVVNQATTINFNVESVDPGNNFDSATDRYTTPETGSYLITLTASPNSSPDRNTLGFYYPLNLQIFNETTNTILIDNRTIRNATPGAIFLGSASSLQGIVSLTAGQQVSVRIAINEVTNAAAGASEGVSLPDSISFAPQTNNRVIFSIVKL